MSTLHFSTEQKWNLDSLSGGSNSHDDNPMRGDFFFSFSEIGSHISQLSCISENDLELLIFFTDGITSMDHHGWHKDVFAAAGKIS